MRIWAMAIATVLAWTTTTQSAPIEFKEIPAGAKWLAHADVDAMRESSLVPRGYRFLINEHPKVEEHLERAERDWGIDPRRSLHSLTFYDTEIVENQGVVVVKADFNQELLLEEAGQAPDHEATKHGDYELHTWTEHKGKKGEHKATGAFFSPSVLVFGSTVERVKQALDLLAGKGESLAGKDAPLASEVPAGTTVLARITGLEGVKLPAKSPVLKGTKEILLAMGEHEGQAFLRSTSVVADEQMAQQVKQVLEGGKAMAALQSGGDADAKTLIDATKIEVAGATVRFEVTVGADHVWNVGKKIRAEIEKKHGRRAEQTRETGKDL